MKKITMGLGCIGFLFSLTACFDSAEASRYSHGPKSSSVYTYQWIQSGFAACSATACGTSGVQTQTVQCKRNDGVIVEDFNCIETKPGTSQVCFAPVCTPTPPPTTFSWIMGAVGSSVANMSIPSVSVPYIDPVYGLKITRATTSSQITDKTPPSFVLHEYSRRPAFNSDGTKALMFSGSYKLYSVDKAGNKMIFDHSISLTDKNEANWHPTDPNVFYYLSGKTIRTYNVATRVTALARDLTNLLPFGSSTSLISTLGEGRPSSDAKIWCLLVYESSNTSAQYGSIAYNFETNQVVGKLATTQVANNISTSPKGNYCVPAYEGSIGTRAYDLTFANYKQLGTGSAHGDVALTASGAEVLAVADNTSTGAVYMADMATGIKTELFKIWGANSSTTSLHISGVSTSKPGYIVVSMFNCKEGPLKLPCTTNSWTRDKLAIVELKATPKIYNVAQMHIDYDNLVQAYGASSSQAYYSQPHAVPSKDLSKILFVSPWSTVSYSNYSSYMVDVPVGSLP
jgi:hypothetical protein